ncbi:MAG: pyridoxal phosphate-dependent aminotransferase [Proteobacteria bacterium]|nr:pyridoxal phosphate-dependent aminotransferase [Pseudomonadota bacterium]MBU1744847.1 pyridoxal phosphate-dependent aminotransferase [Pseudomonadota bacterium]MBU1964558.1 pyridoxal phosphate-dependent aminotransferase [Pseudomonadota bacterium]MBU4581916.1 pyridoxal phosphate-dependent aminotransferase [Pseudomonadota bacterium]
MKLASRIALIKPSPTLTIQAKANALKAAGRDIIGFGAGEPDFDTPLNIKEAAIRAIHAGFTKYTPVGGTDELKDAVIAKFQRDNHLTYRRSEIVISCGAKHSLFNVAQVLFEEGDEVLIPSPYWVSYTDIVYLTGAKPVVIPTRVGDGFKLQPSQLEAAITPRTRAIIISYPSNPAGVCYSRRELEELAAVILRKGIMIISDDIYEKIIYDDQPFFTLASLSDELKRISVVINGVSKSYSMTGWRIGYAAGSEEIVSAVTKYQSQNTSNPTSIAQKAAVEALNGPQEGVGVMAREFQKRRDFIIERLTAIPGVTCLKPQGAFYVFPNVGSYYGRSYEEKIIRNSAEMATYLLDEANVALVPGGDFGHDDHIRISYATPMEQIEKGVERIRLALLKLR